MIHSSSHTFSVFYSDLIGFFLSQEVLVVDSDFVFRVFKVLRLRKNDQLIVFNDKKVFLCSISDIDPKKCLLLVLKQVVQQEPFKLSLNIGLLKKASFEEAVYFAVEAGVSEIQPIIADKIHHNFWSDQELIRLQKIIIGAREQSKNFLPVKLLPPQSLDQLFQNSSKKGTNFLFDQSGSLFWETRILFDNLTKDDKNALLNIFIGPEAGFSDREVLKIKENNAQTIRLTKTVLRAPEAVLLAVSLFRLE